MSCGSALSSNSIKNLGIISTHLPRPLLTPSRQMSSMREQDITRLLSRQHCSRRCAHCGLLWINSIGSRDLKPLFRYFDLRRRAPELRELHYYDTYVPLVPEIETRFMFDQAAEMVLGALEPLGKHMSISWRKGCAVVAGAIATKRKANAAAPLHSGSYQAPPVHSD